MSKIFCFSDTHSRHEELIITDEILSSDLIICAGDSSNHWDVNINHGEELRFLEWYGKIPVTKKIFCSGNHNTAIGSGLITKEQIESYGLIYLEDSMVEINGCKIWGSPWSPTFGRSGLWGFNKSRQKLGKYWQQVPEDLDVIINHGPPYGILDICYDINDRSQIVNVGDKAFRKYCDRHENLTCIFGHIHDGREIVNHGKRIIDGNTYINASCQHDHSDKFNQGVFFQLPEDPPVNGKFVEEVLNAKPFPTIDYGELG